MTMTSFPNKQRYCHVTCSSHPCAY